jgi:hypothetical protein
MKTNKINLNDPVVKQQAAESLAFIAKLSSFIRRNNLERLREVETRFNSVECAAVVAKSYEAVQNAMRQIDLGYADLSHGYNVAIADYLLRVVKTISVKLDIPMPGSSDINFSVKFSEGFMSKTLLSFPADKNDMTRRLLAEFEAHTGLTMHYLREFLYSFKMYIYTMDTLTSPTEFPDYEKFLAEKIQLDGWMTSGCPNDLLVLDLEDLRNPSLELDGIYSAPDKCSTKAVLKGDKVTGEFTLLVQKA